MSKGIYEKLVMMAASGKEETWKSGVRDLSFIVQSFVPFEFILTTIMNYLFNSTGQKN